jgi:hypothetical protein
VLPITNGSIFRPGWVGGEWHQRCGVFASGGADNNADERENANDQDEDAFNCYVIAGLTLWPHPPMTR